MRLEVETGGRRRLIDVQRSGRYWTVMVDGRATYVSLARVGTRWSMLVHRSEVDGNTTPPETRVDGAEGGRSHEIAVEIDGRGSRRVWVDGHAVPLTILDSRSRARSGPGRTAGAEGPIAVPSPMPGRVVKVLVSPGEAVAARQGLVVVEAMKMENELRAPRAGMVAEVRAREGEPVEANTVLVVLH